MARNINVSFSDEFGSSENPVSAIPETNKVESEEDIKKAEEAEKKEKQKKKERSDINNALDNLEDGMDEVSNKLSLVLNLLSENILIDSNTFKNEDIKQIKKHISTINK